MERLSCFIRLAYKTIGWLRIILLICTPNGSDETNEHNTDIDYDLNSWASQYISME